MFLEGELAPDERQGVELHVASCEGCRRALQELRDLTRALSALGPVEPPVELFDAVESAAGRRYRRSVIGATAAVAAVGLVALALAVGFSREPPPTLAPEVGVPVSLRDRAEVELRKAETHYRNAIGMLRRLADAEKTLWPAERRRAYEADIRMLDRTIEDAGKLARRVPTDAALQNMLFASYRSQIDYLRDVLTPRGDDSI